MYHAPPPSSSERPSARQLLRSTLAALAAAAVILVTVVLPAEYAVDPTRMGRVLGLTQMGEIKAQLAAEAEADRLAAATPPPADVALAPELEARLATIEARLDQIATVVIGSSETAPPEVPAVSDVAAIGWTDEITVTLEPGEGIELKLVMQEGATAEFDWTANGGVLNHDTHGDGGGNSISYEKGRGIPGQRGTLTAAFTGNHGWFWRNRTDEAVTLTLRTRGGYSELKQTS